ncbi:amidohydrolase family protein [Moorella naiadis]|uniref:amidohydrolase family protein n=1 Tax=Moorella naiadis (nom. illeg.) TaxID=3093670 RepID=UPI003D9CA054
MTVIDFHHHLLAEEDYLERLIATCDAMGIDKVCLSGLGIGGAGRADYGLGSLSPNNEDVQKAMERYPDRIIGLGVIKLGLDWPEKVKELHDRGFKGLKITRPRANYDDDAYLPFYEKAEELDMPILFHTGIMMVTPADGADDVSSARMRPIYVDRIARKFPALMIILAHLGVPWFQEASELARFHQNVYVDWTGSPVGWRPRKAPGFFQDLFYWDGAFEKVLFGTDVHYREMKAVYDDYRRILRLLNLPESTCQAIMGGTAARLLHLEGGN